MTVAPVERMRRAAAGQRDDVLDTDDRYLRRDLGTLLRAADIFWPSIPEDQGDGRWREVDEFEAALAEAGVYAVPGLRKTLEHVQRTGRNHDLTLKLDEGQFDAAREDLRQTVLALAAWSPGSEPRHLFRGYGDEARVIDAAEKLAMICVPRATLTEDRRARTFDVLHLLAPRLSAERLEAVERCLDHLESGCGFDGALRPGFAEGDRLGVVPVWPDPAKRRRRWAVAADGPWLFASPVEEVTSEEAEQVLQQMAPRWQRARLPDHGAALGAVLVEVAIDSAARRAQALGRNAEDVFPLQGEARPALDRLAEDLAELNAGLDELEIAAADARSDIERKLSPLEGDEEDARLYRSLRASLEEALAKLDRQQQRLQGSFLAAREHASTYHVAETVEELKRHQETIAKTQQKMDEAQRATDRLSNIVAYLAIGLIGPTIVFGALSVTEFWLPGDYPISVALLLAYVLVGLALSVAIAKCIDFITGGFFTRSAPRVRDAGGRTR